MVDFNDVIVSLYPWIRNKAYRYYMNRADAEDLASDTILKLLANKDKFDIERDIKPWCLAIMQNTYITCHNRQRQILYLDDYDYEEPLDTFTPQECASVRDIMYLVCRLNRKSCCIESVMMHARGYSYTEISVSLNIPEGTVRSRINSGRNILRHQIEKELKTGCR